MKKSDAIAEFGSPSKLARAVGLTPGAISQWADDLLPVQRDRVQAAIYRREQEKRGKRKPSTATTKA